MPYGLCFACAFFLCLIASGEAGFAEPRYLWPRENPDAAIALQQAIEVPGGHERVSAASGSFADWLRRLPMKPPQTPVKLYDGRLKWAQDLHVAVIDIDTGKKNLQQCADAIMRLRAEYLLGSNRANEIAFNYTNGKRVAYRGNARNYKAFQRYMEGVFIYAGTYSLEREMRRVPISEISIGDVFIKGGFPGHAVLVIDMAADKATGKNRFLLMQSYMPAQDMHILKNPKAADGSPWYEIPEEGQELVTPEWIFSTESLRRFRN